MQQEKDNIEFNNGAVLIDGVEIPPHVIQEFLKNFLDPHQYHAGILREVIAACADGKMIEDHNGGTLLDKLVLTAEEKRKAEEKEEEIEPCEDDDGHQWSKACGKRKRTSTSYTDHLAKEREENKRAIHCHDAALHSVTS